MPLAIKYFLSTSSFNEFRQLAAIRKYDFYNVHEITGYRVRAMDSVQGSTVYLDCINSENLGHIEDQ